VFNLAGPLPISITNIKAYEENKNIAVEWKVSSELNMKEYEVEKSADGSNFVKVATQPATANNGNDIVYKWLDTNPFNGNNFYRIRAIENSALTKYSAVAKVTIGKNAPAITVFPNPVTNKIFSVQFTAMDKGIYELRLINAAGQLMFIQKINHTGGSATQTVALVNVASGGYQLEIIKPDNTRTVKALIVTN
jgi:hypothetical protein